MICPGAFSSQTKSGWDPHVKTCGSHPFFSAAGIPVQRLTLHSVRKSGAWSVLPAICGEKLPQIFRLFPFSKPEIPASFLLFSAIAKYPVYQEAHAYGKRDDGCDIQCGPYITESGLKQGTVPALHIAHENRCRYVPRALQDSRDQAEYCANTFIVHHTHRIKPLRLGWFYISPFSYFQPLSWRLSVLFVRVPASPFRGKRSCIV